MTDKKLERNIEVEVLETIIKKGAIINIEYSKDDIATILHTGNKRNKELFISIIINGKGIKIGNDVCSQEELENIERVPLVKLKFYKNESIDALIRVLKRLKE